MPTQTTRVNQDYALGYTGKEHQRLMRQAALLAPMTERAFREAGICAGQRVLDLGSGIGDVSLLLAKLVGPTGEVIGVERDTLSIAKAEARVASAGYRNVKFVQSDVTAIAANGSFDAVAGRFILMFLPDPTAVLRAVSQLVRPGGVLVFQEPSWIPMLALAARAPLWFKMLSSIHETFARCGANSELGPDLHRIFLQIGLPAPKMHLEMALGSDIDSISIMTSLLESVRPTAEQNGVGLAELGDLDTLPTRILSEIKAAEIAVSIVPIVSAYSHKP
jgi:2-polyprenyl-3-methyl-5-hydroxy-6-metoxy-1,4-benzoquinol methylase